MAEIGRERGEVSPVGDLAGSAVESKFLIRMCAKIARGFGGLARGVPAVGPARAAALEIYVKRVRQEPEPVI